jgi:hypothetical protein
LCKNSLYLTLFFLVLLFTGCVPKIKPIEPEVNGNIIDKQTKKPIEDVIVDESIKTDKYGKFLIPQKKELGIATTMGGLYAIKRVFTLKKKGYTPLTCMCSVLITKASCLDEVIMMSKEQKKSKKLHFIYKDSDKYGLYCYE